MVCYLCNNRGDFGDIFRHVPKNIKKVERSRFWVIFDKNIAFDALLFMTNMLELEGNLWLVKRK